MNSIKKILITLTFALLLSTSIFAQEKPNNGKAKNNMQKHVCTDECKANGCDFAMAQETVITKHICTEECKTHGCDYVKAKEAKVANSKAVKHVCTDECKTYGCDYVKAKEAKAIQHVCDDECKTNGCSMAKNDMHKH